MTFPAPLKTQMRQPQDHPWQEGRGRPEGSGFSEVSVEKLRSAFERSGLSKSEVARRMGWTRIKADIHRVSALLGQEPDGAGRVRKRVTYKTALRFCKAIDADPFECDV